MNERQRLQSMNSKWIREYLKKRCFDVNNETLFTCLETNPRGTIRCKTYAWVICKGTSIRWLWMQERDRQNAAIQGRNSKGTDVRLIRRPLDCWIRDESDKRKRTDYQWIRRFIAKSYEFSQHHIYNYITHSSMTVWCSTIARTLVFRTSQG